MLLLYDRNPGIFLVEDANVFDSEHGKPSGDYRLAATSVGSACTQRVRSHFPPAPETVCVWRGAGGGGPRSTLNCALCRKSEKRWHGKDMHPTSSFNKWLKSLFWRNGSQMAGGLGSKWPCHWLAVWPWGQYLSSVKWGYFQSSIHYYDYISNQYTC